MRPAETPNFRAVSSVRSPLANVFAMRRTLVGNECSQSAKSIRTSTPEL
jgi:hypothetical protein